MKFIFHRRTWPRLFPFLWLTCLVGCTDDHPTVLRDTVNLESEKLDRLMSVVDEPSAKAYEVFMLRYVDKQDLLSKRTQKVRDNLEKLEKADFDIFDKIANAHFLALTEASPDDFNEMKKLTYHRHYARYVREMVALRKAEKRERPRLQNVVADLTQKRITELRDKGEANPVVDPNNEWPVLCSLATPPAPPP
jgi:hypothetical protein